MNVTETKKDWKSGDLGLGRLTCFCNPAIFFFDLNTYILNVAVSLTLVQGILNILFVERKKYLKNSFQFFDLKKWKLFILFFRAYLPLLHFRGKKIIDYWIGTCHSYLGPVPRSVIHYAPSESGLLYFRHSSNWF